MSADPKTVRERRRGASTEDPSARPVPAKPPRVMVPGAATAVRLLFGGLARLRDDRSIHPHGVVLRGTFSRRADAPVTGSELLDTRGELPALVRLSRSVGLPDPSPDVLGCAIRIPDAYGPGADQDLLFASSSRRAVARHALVVKRDFLGAFYTCIFPYRLGGVVRMLSVRLDAPAEERAASVDDLRDVIGRGVVILRLSLASSLGGWMEVASIRLESVADDERDIRFNPFNSGAGIEPFGPVHALRDPAYKASQAVAPRH